MFRTLKRIAKSFKYSLIGIMYCLRCERNFRIHTFAALTVLFIAPLYDLTSLQSKLLAITIFLVLIMEMLNTAIENIVDMVTEDYHKLACVVKDLSAGAVGLSAISALVVGYFTLIRDIDLIATFAPLLTPLRLTLTVAFLTAGIFMIFMPLHNKKVEGEKIEGGKKS